MEKKFKLGFMVGRFQPIHKGHQQLIEFGMSLCERFVILVGSSNESRTSQNLLTYAERYALIKHLYNCDDYPNLIVLPIVNIGIGYVPEWGNYLMNTIKLECGEYPDFTICGVEEGRSDYLNNFDITKFIVSRNLINISATEIRSAFIYLYAYGTCIDLSPTCLRIIKENIDNKIIDGVTTYINNALKSNPECVTDLNSIKHELLKRIPEVKRDE